MEKDVLAQII